MDRLNGQQIDEALRRGRLLYWALFGGNTPMETGVEFAKRAAAAAVRLGIPPDLERAFLCGWFAEAERRPLYSARAAFHEETRRLRDEGKMTTGQIDDR